MQQGGKQNTASVKLLMGTAEPNVAAGKPLPPGMLYIAGFCSTCMMKRFRQNRSLCG